MSEETERTSVSNDPVLDDDSHDDPQKGAAIGGIGGAVAGAVAGSMAGPIGTLAGAVIGGIVGAVTSKAAVGAIDKIEHDNTVSPEDMTGDANATVPVDVLPDPMPVGSSDSFDAAEDVPYRDRE